ncbi:MAG: hypothetical protein SAK29_38820, partial [Scytonema sp. PMC 1069.18]|nr:hypothetical protein [Scytonema sp. PMC 1069.18]
MTHKIVIQVVIPHLFSLRPLRTLRFKSHLFTAIFRSIDHSCRGVGGAFPEGTAVRPYKRLYFERSALLLSAFSQNLI